MEVYVPHPLRIQRKRTKGWRMPEGAVYVGRPTMWGNPFPVTDACPSGKAATLFRRLLKMSQSKLYDSIKNENGEEHPLGALEMIMWREQLRRRLPELRGKRLACWCPLDQPCHADVLAELANK